MIQILAGTDVWRKAGKMPGAMNKKPSSYRFNRYKIGTLIAPKLTQKALTKAYTLEEAKEIPGPFVYGLKDGFWTFYIGKTTNARARFTFYANPVRVSANLRKQLMECGDRVRVVILEHNPPDLDAAEDEWIKDGGERLLNVHTGTGALLNHVRERQWRDFESKSFVAPKRPTPDEMRENQALISDWLKTHEIKKIA